ncbi:hypothetical protein KOI35_40960 [Actinoplanes bogorensis]|uniref:DUF998 domain-containing protein n=1 Tax=Paractinoplanes bogorensis TaxID=1610840 RepID=A0ABS5Z309_9ACTN|nr:hypothetical protein [Actinoplanes bogorensis]MBU2669901.1 hypothetical protein [Actinoplanes bogorensis]
MTRVTTRTLGLITIVASLIGAACAVAVLVWPPQVGTGWYSYPFDATGYTVAHVFFAVHHLGMLAGFAGLARLAATHRTTRAGLIIAAAGMVLLAACELFGITAANAPVSSETANAVDNAYGIPMVLIGVGLVLAGWKGSGWQRWVPLALGVYVFVPLFPAVFGPMVAGRIAIGVWFAIFAVLGVALVKAAENVSPAERMPAAR